ncbi:uncharacterized protein LOC120631758 [Pararge aegeria]|uniref:Jg12595 protein n=1 Tax=Pararge aegeria aegeria TaxID=348720 RepID=A0A8S4SCM2_9NEOP|nr:uncharacterized protein LOC120631758 [Pararge aegeria]CAH2258976.1 jg12595 [Pararge aegeria aegeria]
MTLENFHSQMGVVPKQLVDRYAEYPGPVHEQPMYYPYEPSPTSHGHISHISLGSKHHFSGGSHKNNAAMSALTLLAFLFFLHILQQCLREHMTSLSTPQVMIMTGGKEGEETIRRVSNLKVDKSGLSETEDKRNNAFNPDDTTESSKDDKEKVFTKITSSENAPWKKFQNNRHNFKNDYKSEISELY